MVYRGSFLAASGKSNVRVDLSIAAKATVLTFPEFQHSGTFSCKCVSLSFSITYTKVQRVMRFRPFSFRLSTSRCPRAFLPSCSKVSSSYLCYFSLSFPTSYSKLTFSKKNVHLPFRTKLKIKSEM